VGGREIHGERIVDADPAAGLLRAVAVQLAKAMAVHRGGPGVAIDARRRLRREAQNAGCRREKSHWRVLRRGAAPVASDAVAVQVWRRGEFIMECFQRVADRVVFAAEKMKKTNLVETPNLFCDVYAFEAGQSQAAHRHGVGDKLYFVLDGTGRIRVG